MRHDVSHAGSYSRESPPPRLGLALFIAVLASCSSDAPLDSRPISAIVSPAATCVPGTFTASRFRIGIPRHGTGWTLEHEALANSLSRRIGLPVDIILVDRYDELSEGLYDGQLEAAILPPLEYVKAHERDPCLNARLTMVFDGTIHYSSYLVARKDSGLTNLHQLAGRSVAFVDQTSASGWLFPVARLTELSIDPFNSLSDVLFEGNHRAVIEAVISGRATAGATYPSAMESARRDGLDVGALTILGITGRIPHDAFVMRPNIEPSQASAVVAAFASLNTSTIEGRVALAFSEGLCGFVPSSNGFYDQVRDVLRLVTQFGGGTP